MELRRASEVVVEFEQLFGALEVDKDSSAAQQGFAGYLRDLVLFAADGNAGTWRDIWYEWPYSKLVEYSLHMAHERRKRSSDLSEALEGVKDPSAMMAIVMMHRLR